MQKPTIILATSNGIGMGHLTRSSAIAAELKEFSNPIIVSTLLFNPKKQPELMALIYMV